MDSSKRIILITGANAGIGYDASAHLAVASRNNHVIMCVRSLSKGEAALKEIKAKNPAGTLSLLELDVTSDASIAAAAAKIGTDFGRIDVLINNAGIARPAKAATREILRETFETNVFGVMILTQQLEPFLRISKDPRIINVSSGLGSISMRADPNGEYYNHPTDTYRMSKAALNMLTTCQSFAFKDFGARVWSYCPGFVVTDLTGKDDRQRRIDMGAESSETSAVGIVEIVEGKRDVETNKFIQRYGKQWDW
ncbi:short chain dehydrogenase [Polyplosphaeria fusca]|uniref:Short chain dehydrogenase n=1 Tax=Polyplosphaeria fusca TaxID=682080 RepID=A0A9P4QR94_9PLEO|nr:short chain dehydrogenase [Polyplosphaeria fusca]